MLALLLVALGVGEGPVQVKEPARVGQIVIIGNEVTPQVLIADRLQLYPGQVLTAPELRAAQRRLRWLTLLGRALGLPRRGGGHRLQGHHGQGDRDAPDLPPSRRPQLCPRRPQRGG
jgi:hypothetical protein